VSHDENTDRRMTIQSSTGYTPDDLISRGEPFNIEGSRFIVFICRETFPGGRIPAVETMVEHGEKNGFVVPCVAFRMSRDSRLTYACCPWSDPVSARLNPFRLPRHLRGVIVLTNMLTCLLPAGEHLPCDMLSGEFSPQIDHVVCGRAVSRLHRRYTRLRRAP
jgi:hypothetical protein